MALLHSLDLACFSVCRSHTDYMFFFIPLKIVMGIILFVSKDMFLFLEVVEVDHVDTFPLFLYASLITVCFYSNSHTSVLHIMLKQDILNGVPV